MAFGRVGRDRRVGTHLQPDRERLGWLREHGLLSSGLLGLACLCSLSSEAARAQQAVSPPAVPASPTSPAGNVVELPPITVTTASPVKKKPAPKSQGSAGPAAGPAGDAVPAASEPAIIVAPGPLIVGDDAFVPITIATDAEITATGGATITDVLEQKPGIIGSTFAPGANRPIVRGLDTYRIRVQENGIGAHDVSALSEDHAVPIDPFAADRIEVVRGPATLRYGSQAIGGVVSIENERIPSFIPPGGISAEARGGLGSVDDGNDSAFKATIGAGGIAVHADAFYRRAEDYRTPRGRQLNSFVDSEGFALGASHVWSDGFVGVAFTRVESLYGIPGEEAAEASPRIDLNQDKVLAKGEWRVGSSAIDAVRFWFGASDYEHAELAFHEPGEPVREIGSLFTNREQEARIEIQHQPANTVLGSLSGAVGVQWGHREISGLSFEGDSLLDPATTNVIAGFWFEELELSRALRLQAAARIEHANVDGMGIADPFGAATLGRFERSFTPISASLGALRDVGLGVVARLTGQYVERAPDAAELFSRGVHEATGTFEIGNPALEKERAATVELGFKRGRGDLRFDASFYYTRYQGFIFKQLTGVGCGETLASCGSEDELDQLVFGQRGATFRGLELAVEQDLARLQRGVLGIDAQYDLTQAQFTNGENVPRIPPHRLGAGIYWRGDNWFARAGVLHAFDQNRVGFNEIATPGYTLVSAEVSYTSRLAAGRDGPELTIGIRGENLADDEVLNHASFKRREGVLEPGANVRLFGSVKLN